MSKKSTGVRKDWVHPKHLNGRSTEESLYRTLHATHDTTVCHCDYCGRPMNASERNDFGSLCETCYMEEYYGK